MRGQNVGSGDETKILMGFEPAESEGSSLPVQTILSSSHSIEADGVRHSNFLAFDATPHSHRTVECTF